MVDLADFTACKRCGCLFRRMHGNRRYCGPGCRRPRPPARPFVAFDPRWCELCGRQYVPSVWHQRFCSSSCGVRVRDAVDRVKYRDQQRQRAVWRARVASGRYSLPARCHVPVCGAGRRSACWRSDLAEGGLAFGSLGRRGRAGYISRASNLQRVSTKPPSGESEARPVTHSNTVAVGDLPAQL